jgi:putative DNA methylase
MGKTYLQPELTHSEMADKIVPSYILNGEIADNPGHTNVYRYGLTTFADLFTQRQIVALMTFSDLVNYARERVMKDAIEAGLPEGKGINENGQDAKAYSESVAIYLSFAIDRFADYWSSLNSWQSANQQLSHTFSRQAFPMTWDFAEANPFSGKGGGFENLFEWTIQSISTLGYGIRGSCMQIDATSSIKEISNPIISTDPPYYDNIGYADLSDFFLYLVEKTNGANLSRHFQYHACPKSKRTCGCTTPTSG